MHLHARDPDTGEPTGDPDVFARFLPRIAAESDVIVNITTGGAATMTVEERTRAARRFEPELISLNMGSMNFGLYGMLRAVEEFRYAWEEPYLEGSRDRIFRNTFADIEAIVGAARHPLRVRVLRRRAPVHARAHAERGVVQPPLFVQTVLGIPGGSARIRRISST